MKAILKAIYFTFLALLLGSVQASELSKEDFKVTTYGEERFLQKKDSELKLYKLTAPHYAKVIDVINNPQAPHLYFITYISQTAGTSVLATFYRAAVWDQKKQMFKGDVLYKVVVNKNGKQETELAQWKFEKDKMIVIHDKEQIGEISY